MTTFRKGGVFVETNAPTLRGFGNFYRRCERRSRIGGRVLFREALAPLQERYAHSPKKLAALKEFSDRIQLDGAPISATVIHPIVGMRYWANEARILRDTQKLQAATPIGTIRLNTPERQIKEYAYASRLNSLAKITIAGITSLLVLPQLKAILTTVITVTIATAASACIYFLFHRNSDRTNGDLKNG